MMKILKKKSKKKKKFSFEDYNDVLEDINKDDDELVDSEKGEILFEDLKDDDIFEDFKEEKSLKKDKKKKGKKSKVKSKKVKVSKKKGKMKRPIWKKLLTLLILMVSAGIFAVGAFLVYIIVTTSDFNPEALKSQEQSIVYSADGTEIASLGYELREKVSYDELPQVLIDAIVATEDSRFFQHSGVDLPRFLKASLGQLTGNSSAGGASTLTMQVVKNNLTSTERSIIRKFKDMYLATFFMERKYSKEEILEFYVNDSSLGSNVYGVGEASEYYFGKSVSELSLPEAALIAGLYQAPNAYNPYYNPENANKRINTVLKLMVRHGYITKEEAEAAGSVDISDLLVGLKNSDNKYQGYLDTVLVEVEEKTGYSPYMVSMKIYTALDTKMQDGVNDAFTGKTFKWENDKVQAGAAIINCNTGEIVAVGTGRKANNDALTWNYATATKRQPGSTAKPLFAYGPGMEYLGFSTGTLFMDEAWSYSNGISVSNWDNGYQGLMTLRQAVAVSRNIPALKAFQQVNKEAGNAKIVEFVENLGIDLKDDVAYESYAIGGLEEGVTPVQMAGAYATFANGGKFNTPHTITKIEYRETGEVVEFKPENKQVMKESTAYLMNNTLEYAVNNGFSGGAKVYGSHTAAKTGTSNFSEETRRKYGLPGNAENDLWTVGYTKDYSVAVWYGYDTVKDGYNTTSYYKELLMSTIFQYIPKETQGWSVPDSVRAVAVERETVPLQLPSEYTPSDFISTEYFSKDYVPVDTSPRFSKLSPVTGLTASSSGGVVNLSWNANPPEVIGDDYLNKYFSQAAWGHSGETYKNNRKAYINNTMGGYGFYICMKDKNGSLTNCEWTDKKTYSYRPKTLTKDVTIVVTASYKNFKANASDGVSKDVTVSLLGGLSVKIKNSNLVIDKGAATESDFSYNVTSSGININNNPGLDMGFQLVGNSTDVTLLNITDLVNEVNSLPPNTYNVRYKASFNGSEETETMILTIK